MDACVHDVCAYVSEEVGHDFRGMQVKLSRTIGKALFLLLSGLTWVAGAYIEVYVKCA